MLGRMLRGPHRGVLTLIIINTALFILHAIVVRTDAAPVIRHLTLVPADTVLGFKLWQPFTYMWLHSLGGPWHLLTNMIMLWFFGSDLETMIGTKRLVRTYIYCGLAGAIFTILIGGLAVLTFGPSSELGAFWLVSTLGASGAVSGVTFAWAGLLWNQTRRFLFLGEIKVKHFAYLIAFVEFLAAISFGGAAWTAHLGGMVLGYLIGRGRFPPPDLKRWWLKRKHARTQQRLRRFDVIEGGRKRDGDDNDTAGRPLWGPGRGDGGGPTVH